MNAQEITNEIMELRQDINELSDAMMAKKLMSVNASEMTNQDMRDLEHARTIIQYLTKNLD